MNNPILPPASAPEFPDMNERIMNTVRAHRWKSRVLAGIALILGFAAIAASIAIVWAYFILYRPKEKQLLRDYPLMVQRADTNSVAGDSPNDGRTATRRFNLNDLNQAHLTMTYAIGMGTALIAISVALLGLGTLVTLVLVLLNRRVTLRQINTSLGQISDQIKELQNPKSAGPTASG